MRLKKYSYYFILSFLFLLFSCEKTTTSQAIPASSFQAILVLTDSLSDSSGILYYFERERTDSKWNVLNEKIPVVLGRSGLGWGIGLHDSTNKFNYPIKQEGDGRSPAGIFNLSFVFGYKPKDQMHDIKMPYVHITEMVECVDDINSKYYNQVVSKDKIESEKIDWKSSEKMYYYDIYYEIGVFVDHNVNPQKKKHGSCIFLHNWDNPNEAMSGCTAMEPKNMHKIVKWLNKEKQPVLIQLTRQTYIALQKEWALPNINR